MTLSSEIRQHVRKLGSCFPELEGIWLLGSRANGTARPDSDWDLLAFARPPGFQRLRSAQAFKRSDVDLLVVHDGLNFEEPWPIATPERPHPKAGDLRSWEWNQESEDHATYWANKEGRESDIMRAVRVWPEK
jgi:predicted nucleotidyltransferase